MLETITVSSRGQIVIPEAVRKRLHIKEGTKLIMVEKGNKELLGQAVIKVLLDKSLLKKLKEKSGERALDFDVKKIIKEWQFLENGKN